MIIVLPSAYTGAEVHVTHSSKTKVIGLASDSLRKTSVLAWYTDVVHEVKPVQSGYRFALSYNLIHTSTSIPKPMLPNMGNAVSSLLQVLKNWKEGAYLSGPGKQQIVAYLLKHQYSEMNLLQGLRAMKGGDAHKLAYLKPTCC